jgi:hypothetical protein
MQLRQQPRPRLGAKLMLPQPHDLPAGPTEVPRVTPIPFAVTPELRAPEGGVALGLRAVPRTAVPEAAVDEDHEPPRPEDEVGPHPERLTPDVAPAHGLLPPPARPALGPQDGRQGSFGGGVAPTAHLGHQGAALGAGIDVRHVLSWI